MWIRKKSKINPGIASCLNCGQPFSAKAKYCEQCGQVRTDGRITFRQLLRDAFDDIFNLDSRVFLSLKDLFVPGRLSQRFFEGKHQSYYPPVRFFFISMVIQFTLLGFALNSSVEINSEQLFYPKKAIIAQEKLGLLDSIQVNIYSSLAQQEKDLLDSLNLRLTNTAKDSVTLTLFNFGSMGSTDAMKIAVQDVENMTAAMLRNKYGITGKFRNIIALQTVRTISQPNQVFRFLIGNLVWMVLALVPCLAILMKLIYFRRNLYYVEHIIFLFHNHVFLFVLLSILHLCSFFYSAIHDSLYIFLLLFVIYTYLSMLKYYGQSWWKTLLKLMLVSLSYAFLLAIFFAITAFISLLLFQ